MEEMRISPQPSNKHYIALDYNHFIIESNTQMEKTYKQFEPATHHTDIVTKSGLGSR